MHRHVGRYAAQRLGNAAPSHRLQHIGCAISMDELEVPCPAVNQASLASQAAKEHAGVTVSVLTVLRHSCFSARTGTMA